jgi:hypothetical protein
MSRFLFSVLLPLIGLLPFASQSALGATCDSSFRNTKQTVVSESGIVYVQMFDTGAGRVRVVRGRVDMAEHGADGQAVRYEIFHDRGRGTYLAQDVFYPIEPHWVKVHGRTGYDPVVLVAELRDRSRVIGRNEQGELRVFRRDRDIFPIYVSDR